MKHEEFLTQVKTKIIATLGPASDSLEMITNLATAGVDVFRLNMAHGVRSKHEEVVRRIRTASDQLMRPIAIIVDLAGPKIRLGTVPDDSFDAKQDSIVKISNASDSASGIQLTTNYPSLTDYLREGQQVLLADGEIAFVVEEVNKGIASCRVEQEGVLRSRQGIHFPGLHLPMSSLTPQDLENVDWAANQQVDFIGLSFVSSAEDILELRCLLEKQESPVQIVAKIERAIALERLDSIVEVADAVMVARGDLGMEIEVERVPIVQKQIIALCQKRCVPVITATQMLDSMRHATRPTRAESTDVANAILDGTDAVMLSGETAIGRFPVEAVSTMSRIAKETEHHMETGTKNANEMAEKNTPVERYQKNPPVTRVTRAIVHGSNLIGNMLDAKLIVVATHTGRTALALSKTRNTIPTVATSDMESTLRRVCLYWGVTPWRGSAGQDSEKLLQEVIGWGEPRGVLQRGDRVVLLASTDWTPEGNNVVFVHEV